MDLVIHKNNQTHEYSSIGPLFSAYYARNQEEEQKTAIIANLLEMRQTAQLSR